MRLTRSFLALIALLLVTSSCASMRGVSVGSDTSSYAIDVTNTTARSADVYWSAGGDPKLLGSVGPGRKEHFIIAGAASSNVSVTARDTSGRTLGPYSVLLAPGVTKAVTLR